MPRVRRVDGASHPSTRENGAVRWTAPFSRTPDRVTFPEHDLTVRQRSPIALVIAATAVLGLAAPVQAAQDQVVTRGTFTVEFRDLTGTADQAVADRLIETFFAVYPQMVADYNPAAPRRVQIAIDPAWTGVAAVQDGRVMINPDWLRRHPGDIDLLTHELMHVVQAVKRPHQAGWLIEGSADYARSVYGVDNAGAGWALQAPGPETRYTDGYRTSARFFAWLESHGHRGIVKTLIDEIRDGKYNDRRWKTPTGETIDQLWAAYVADSRLVVRVGATPVTPEKMLEIQRLIRQLEAEGSLRPPTPPAEPAPSAGAIEGPHS